MSRIARVLSPFVLAVSFVSLAAAPAVAGSSGGGSGKNEVQITQFHVTLTSQGSDLHQVGADGEITYGSILLTGTGASDSGDIQVELQGAVNYENGDGRFSGFVTLTFASQAQVGFTMTGEASATDAGGADLTSKLRVIEGTGAMIGVKGVGAWTGSRDAAVGAPIEADFVIKLRGVDIG